MWEEEFIAPSEQTQRESERGKVCAECLAFSIRDLHRPLYSTGTLAQALSMLGKITLDSRKLGPFLSLCKTTFASVSLFLFCQGEQWEIWRPSFGQV